MVTFPDADNPSYIHTSIGWIDVGSWYRYTFYVPAPGPGDPPDGWVRFTFRVASPSGGTLAAYWDETLVGIVEFVTGHWHIYTYATLEEQIQTTPGRHKLRVQLAAGQMNFDKIGIGFNWLPPLRGDLFVDDFEGYQDLYGFDGLEDGGWTVVNGSGEPDAAWRLWNTGGDLLGNQDPDIQGMTDNYLITNSDSAPDAEMDEELITPAIDCTRHRAVRLEFSKNYRVYVDDLDHLQIAEVNIRCSEDGESWGQWVNLLHWDRSIVGEYATGPEQVDISTQADGKFIQIRWHFYDAVFDYWFSIDDVRVSGEREEPPVIVIRDLGYVAGVATLSWDEFGGGNYTVEYADDLTSGGWQPVPGEAWPMQESTWSADITAIFGQGVYLRVRSE
jgi:hypothetical protein